MSAKDVVRYLIGDPRAILRIAKTPSSFWVGLLFVFSAAIARIYDGQDILGEPWHLFVPFGASLLTATILFLMLRLVLARWGISGVKVFSRYRAFISLFWMTAPLAWLYAIPVEQFLSARDSTLANVLLLGIVAAWRVTLTSRVAAVLFRAPVSAFPVVMLFADTVALIVLIDLPKPNLFIIRGMSGVTFQLPESDAVLIQAVTLVAISGFFTFPIWLIWTLGVFIYKGRSARVGRMAPNQLGSRKTDRSVWLLAFASILFWIPILPFTQPAQQLRSSVEHDLCNGNIERGVETMSKHAAADFPRFWEPPPRLAYPNRTPPLIDILSVCYAKDDTAPWVREWYEKQLTRHVRNDGASLVWIVAKEDEYDRMIAFFEKLPDDSPLLRAHVRVFQEQMFGDWPRANEKDRAQRFQAILTRLGEESDFEKMYQNYKAFRSELLEEELRIERERHR